MPLTSTHTDAPDASFTGTGSSAWVAPHGLGGVPSSNLVGRFSAGTGAPEDVALGTDFSLGGTGLLALGTTGITAAAYGGVAGGARFDIDAAGRMTGASNVTLTATNPVILTTSGTTGLGWSFATSGVTAGTYGNSTAVGQVTVDAFGRVTAASNVTIAAGASSYIAAAALNTAVTLVTGTATVISTAIAAVDRDVVVLEIAGEINNNSGASQTYQHTLSWGTLSVLLPYASVLGANAASRMPVRLKAIIAVGTSSSSIRGDSWGAGNQASGTGAAINVNFCPTGWAGDAADYTGTQTLKHVCFGTGTAATQTFHLNAYTIRRISAL